MGTDKRLLVGELRSFATRAAALGEVGAELRAQLEIRARMLENEAAEEERLEGVANRGTRECDVCHGTKVVFAYVDYVQCPRCRGWGRVPG